MEILLTVTIVTALVALGVTISLGNERQRQAIQGLREQVRAWTEQDIRLKREKLSRSVVVEDAQGWLIGLTARLWGVGVEIVKLTTLQVKDAPAVVMLCQDGRRLVLTPTPHQKFLEAVTRRRKGALAQMEVGVLGSQPRRVPVTELSVVNAGMFFDLEAQQAWKLITGQTMATERLWLYEVPPHKQV